MGHLGILAISALLIVAAVAGDGAPEAAETSPVNKAPYTLWFPAKPLEEQISPVLSKSTRELSINEDDDAIKQLAIFIKENIRSYSKVKLKKKIKISVNNVKVNDLYWFEKVGERKKDKVLLRTATFNVENHSNSVMESQSQAYTYTRSHTQSVTVSRSIGLSGGIKFPFMTSSFEFKKDKSSTKTESTEETAEVPSQSVKLNPWSKRKLTFNLVKEELVEEYRASFLVDKNSTFKVSRKFKKSKNVNLLDFLEEMHKKKRKINIPNMEYNYKKKTLIMKNYPVTRDVIDGTVNLVFGGEEPL